MPTRQLKPGLKDSQRFNRCSWPPQCLYMRLLMLVDDYARFDANTELLASVAFPYGKPNGKRVLADDVANWLGELEKADLLAVYSVNGGRYIQLYRWAEKCRVGGSRYPDPPANVWQHFLETAASRWQLSALALGCKHLPADSGKCPPSSSSSSSSSGEEPSHFPEQPADVQVREFAKEWPGELSSSTPKIPVDYVDHWLKRMTGRTLGWPLDWKRNLIAGWRADFRGWGKVVLKKNTRREAWHIEKDLKDVEESIRTHPANSWPANKPLDENVQAEFEALKLRRAELRKEAAVVR